MRDSEARRERNPAGYPGPEGAPPVGALAGRQQHERQRQQDDETRRVLAVDIAEEVRSEERERAERQRRDYRPANAVDMSVVPAVRLWS